MLFIITSALNTKFGVFSNNERLGQTIDTIKSINQYSPNAKIAFVEMGGIEPDKVQVDEIKKYVDFFICYSNDQNVKKIFSSENWDVVKNLTEVLVFKSALLTLLNSGILNQFERIFKISGRYKLTNNFNNDVHVQAKDKFVFLEKRYSQFEPVVTGGTSYQYMSRLFSWQIINTEMLIKVYECGFADMNLLISNGGYMDIEHMLFKYIHPDLVKEVKEIGVSGLLGPNGSIVFE